MHARNRYQGNGHRSNSMLMGGMGIASRVLPDSSIRPHGPHAYDYPTFDHGAYGRGQFRPHLGAYGPGHLRPDHVAYGPAHLRPDHGDYGQGHFRQDHAGYVQGHFGPDHAGYGPGHFRPDHSGYGQVHLRPDHAGYGQGQSRPDHEVYGLGQSRPDHGGYGLGQSRLDHGDYGQGQSRQFQQPPQERQSDVFMEAGRLATEYLVAKGLVPPNVLGGKWRSDSFDNQVGADVTRLPLGRRTSALSRLGGPVTDVRPVRRRDQDDSNAMSSNNTRHKRSGSLKSSSPEGSREFRKSGSLSDKSRGSVAAVVDKDALSNHRHEKKVSNNSGRVSRNRTPELASEKHKVGMMGSSLKKYALRNSAGTNASSSSSEKDLSVLGEVEPSPKADEPDTQPEAGEIKDEDDCPVTGQHHIKDDVASQEAENMESVPSENGGVDLIKSSSFVDIPSKASSPLAFQEIKVDAVDITTSADTLQDEPPKESGSCVNNTVVNSLPVNDDSSVLQLGRFELPSKDDELLVTHENSLHESPASVLKDNESSSKEQVTNEELPESVLVKTSEGGEKRALSEESPKEENKRPKLSAVSESIHSEVLASSEKQPTKEEPKVLEDGAVLLASDEKISTEMSFYPRNDIETILDYTEERQLFPCSFKTFDLNLMEVSDMNGNHEKKNISLFSSETESNKQPMPVDIDLSMNNNFHASGNFGKRNTAGTDIEVIDLEKETEQVGRDFNNSERSDRSENAFPCLDGYSNNTHNGNDTSDAQDGYGLMISELLGNDLPSCSSVSTDLSSLHSDMGLHGSENILGDDDSIYMSLDEIPISFLRVWEQPGQDYSKPF